MSRCVITIHCPYSLVPNDPQAQVESQENM